LKFVINRFSKQKVKALYGSWIFDLFGVDNDKYEEYMKTRTNNSPKHTVAVSRYPDIVFSLLYKWPVRQFEVILY